MSGTELETAKEAVTMTETESHEELRRNAGPGEPESEPWT